MVYRFLIIQSEASFTSVSGCFCSLQLQKDYTHTFGKCSAALMCWDGFVCWGRGLKQLNPALEPLPITCVTALALVSRVVWTTPSRKWSEPYIYTVSVGSSEPTVSKNIHFGVFNLHYNIDAFWKRVHLNHILVQVNDVNFLKKFTWTNCIQKYPFWCFQFTL